MDFPAKCKQYGIPVSALHLSSGYTVDVCPFSSFSP